MRHRAKAMAAFTMAALAAAAPLRAQRTWGRLGADGKRIVSGAAYLWSAPARLGTDDLPELIGVLGTFAVTTAYDADIQRWVRTHPRSAPVQAAKPFRGGRFLEQFGLTRSLFMLSAGIYAVGFASDSRALREAATGCITVDGANTTVRHGIYLLVSRERPTNGDTGERFDDANVWDFPGGDWQHHSFFGGHVADIMSCASFWNHRFHLGPLEPLLYAAALGVGAGRLVDEHHWMSDTLLGIAFGYAYGAGLARRYEREDARRTTALGDDAAARSPPSLPDRLLAAAPAARLGHDARGERTVLLVWNWRF